jgi:hypothetical protein
MYNKPPARVYVSMADHELPRRGTVDAGNGTSIIVQDLPFEERWHNFERFIWILLVALLLAGCLGYLGLGPRAVREVRDPSGALSVRYDRIVRDRATAGLDLAINGSATATGEISIVLGGALASKAAVQSALPPPVSSTARGSEIVMTWRVEPRQPATVSLEQRIARIGRLWSHIAVNGRPAVVIEQISLP